MKALKWIWLAEKLGQGSAELLSLIERFGSIDSIYGANYEKYAACGLGERLCESLCDKTLDRPRQIVSYCQQAGVGLLCYDDGRYPASLRSLKNPPALLYYLGKLPDFNRKLCIAMVGTRKMSEYGMRAAYKIAYEVAASGAVVVSGLALGIDGVASCAAVAAGGVTVGVLGCGIDIVYPKEHATLYGIVKQNGVVLTEYPPATEPRGGHFPVRNRIISGLCQGTAVIDADQQSGAMITAKNAILQGRDIYAVPGNIDAENTSGTNSLIRDGAQAVLCGSDIIKNYAYMYRDCLDIQRMNNAEQNSEFNPDMIRRMGVSVSFASTVGRPATNRSESERLPVQKGGRRKPAERTGERAVEESAPMTAEKPTEKVASTVAPKKEEAPKEAASGDRSAEILSRLGEKQRKIFEEMPLDRAVTVDYLTKTGFALGEVISALTVLEIKGLVSSLPGALYIRK